MRQKRVLTLFKKEKTLSFREIYKHFKTGSSERTLKKDISDLRDKGFITLKGKGPASVWEEV